MNNNDVLNLYLSTFNSDNTKVAYRKILGKFLVAVGKNVADITPLDCNMFVVQNYNDIKVTTRNMRVTMLKAFSKWMVQNGIITTDFGAGLKQQRGEAEPKDKMTKEDAVAMYAKGNARERAIISLLLNTGLRISEVINLKLADLDESELKVKTKGARFRTIYLNDDTRRDIASYIGVRKAGTDYLFTSNTGTKLEQQSVNNSWAKLARKANVDKHITSHSFRRLVVTEVVNDYGIAVAQKFIGHKSIATTARYYQADEEQIKNIYLNMEVR